MGMTSILRQDFTTLEIKDKIVVEYDPTNDQTTNIFTKSIKNCSISKTEKRTRCGSF